MTMKLSDETKAVDMIRSGVETKATEKKRVASENVAMAKAFVKAAFVDLQTTVFANMDYSPHRVTQFLEQTKRFENAIRAYQKEENRLLMLLANANASDPVGAAAVKPADLTQGDKSWPSLKQLGSTSDEASV